MCVNVGLLVTVSKVTELVGHGPTNMMLGRSRGRGFLSLMFGWYDMNAPIFLILPEFVWTAAYKEGKHWLRNIFLQRKQRAFMMCMSFLSCKSYRVEPVVFFSVLPTFHTNTRRHTHTRCPWLCDPSATGQNGMAPARPNKLINQAGWGVGGRRTQQRISLSYFTALLISIFIDDDYSHSVRGYYCFHNM